MGRGGHGPGAFEPSYRLSGAGPAVQWCFQDRHNRACMHAWRRYFFMLVLRDYIVSYSAMYSIRSCPGMQLKQNIFSANPSINYPRNADAKLTAKTKPSPKPKHHSPTFHLFFFCPSRYPSLKVRLFRLHCAKRLISIAIGPSSVPPRLFHHKNPLPTLAAQITRRRGARRPTSNVDVRSPSPSVVSKFGELVCASGPLWSLFGILACGILLW